MSAAPFGGTIRAQSLMGRRVEDHRARRLGHVFELEAQRAGDRLCVTALLIGPRSWLTRFGWTTAEHGRRVPWEDIAELDPVIRLRAGATDGTR